MVASYSTSMASMNTVSGGLADIDNGYIRSFLAYATAVATPASSRLFGFERSSAKPT